MFFNFSDWSLADGIDILQKVNSDGNSNRIQVGKSSWLYLIFLIMSGLISHIQLLFLIFSLLGETRDNFFRFWLELITSFKTLGSAKQFVQSKYSRLELLIVPEQMIYYWFVFLKVHTWVQYGPSMMSGNPPETSENPLRRVSG